MLHRECGIFIFFACTSILQSSLLVMTAADCLQLGRALQTSGRGEGRIAELEAIFDTDAVDSINSMDILDDNLYAFRSSVADAIAAKRALVRSKLSAIRSR